MLLGLHERLAFGQEEGRTFLNDGVGAQECAGEDHQSAQDPGVQL